MWNWSVSSPLISTVGWGGTPVMAPQSALGPQPGSMAGRERHPGWSLSSQAGSRSARSEPARHCGSDHAEARDLNRGGRDRRDCESSARPRGSGPFTSRSGRSPARGSGDRVQSPEDVHSLARTEDALTSAPSSRCRASCLSSTRRCRPQRCRTTATDRWRCRSQFRRQAAP